jgi:hypothetical protein
MGAKRDVEVRIRRAVVWFASEESRDPAWHVIPLGSGGRVLCLRPAIRPAPLPHRDEPSK